MRETETKMGRVAQRGEGWDRETERKRGREREKDSDSKNREVRGGTDRIQKERDSDSHMILT